jgi:SAM-dependent methyltransferase
MTTSMYAWDNAMAEGRRRLALLERALDPTTFRHLEALGVGPGWQCLEVGAGGGSVTERLCDLVGPAGRVTAIDLDARFVRALDRANLDVREDDVAEAVLPTHAFDLVHTRWALMHIAQRESLLPRLVAALRPGGTLFLEEPDSVSTEHLDRTGFHDVSMRVFHVVMRRGSAPFWARELPGKVAALGMSDVRASAAFDYFRGGSELAEFWKISWGRVRDGVAGGGVDASAWGAELAELDDPSRLFVGPATIAVIARKGGVGRVGPMAPRGRVAV